MLARAPSTRLSTCLFGLAGLAAGLLGAGAWRHATTRYLVDVSPPRVAPGDKGYTFTFDYLKYVSGPSWWPATGILALAGLTIGLLFGVTYPAISRRFASLGARVVTAIGMAALTGICIGSVTYLYGQLVHPSVNLRAIIDPTYRGPSLASDSRIVRGAPWLYELSPSAVYLPLLGAITVVLILLILGLVHSALCRSASRLHLN